MKKSSYNHVGFIRRRQLENIARYLGLVVLSGKSNADLVSFILRYRPAIGDLKDKSQKRNVDIIVEWFHFHENQAIKPIEYRKTKKRYTHPVNRSSPSDKAKAAFYKSWDWRTLRMEVLKEYGARCECCGSTPRHTDTNGDPVKICVDHIKPISRHWNLRLDKSNLQVLCDECNQGKGAWDQSDWREIADNNSIDCDDDDGIPRAIRDQLRYSI